MFQDTQPARLDAGDGLDPLADFRVESPTEARAWLRRVRDAAVPVSLVAPRGASLGCTLWSADTPSRRVVFSADPTHPQLQSIVDSGEAFAVTYLDSVKLQFDVDDLVLVHGAAGAALQASIAGPLYRFQRRESFRVRPAGRQGPRATLRHPALPEMLLELRILDLSVGGCAILVPPDVPDLSPGVVLHGVQVQLDAESAFVAGLLLHHVSSMEPSEQGHRIGCEWRLLEPAAARALQRYVDQTQKRQRLMRG